MSNLQNLHVSLPKVRTSDSVVPRWKLVLKRELIDLWISGRGLTLLLFYSILLGIMAYIYSLSAELSLVSAQEAVFDFLKNGMAFSTFMGLIISADSISGERDRATLESLLLTPVDRRHIVIAKLLAGISLWPAAYLIGAPFLYLLAHSNKVLGPALFWGAVTGTLLVLGYTGLGMLISFWSSSNKISYFVSLSIYALLLLPVELSEDGVDLTAEILLWVNPVAAVNYFLSNRLVYHNSVAEYWPWLVSSALLIAVTLGLLLKYAGSLRMETGLRRRLWARLSRAIGLSIIIVLFIVSLPLASVKAIPENQAEVTSLHISMDSKFRLVKMGDIVEFNTVITNDGLQDSEPLIVAMNVVNLQGTGQGLDVEEWAPERTQYIDSLAPDETIRLDWIITTGLDGDYMVYIVVIPQPASAEVTTYPVASSSLHLTVAPSARLNPGSVLPFALGVPVFLLAITFVVYRRRRQQIDMGDSL